MSDSGSTGHAVVCFPESRFALAQLRGDIYGDDIVEVGRMIAYNPGWQPGFTEVWNMNLTDKVDISPVDLPKLQALETELKERLAGTRTITVVNRPMLRYSLQFYAHMVRPFGREIVVVNTPEEAAELLGIDELPVLG